jgi:hypothetical protein
MAKLELEQNERLQRGEWRLQRAGHVALCAVTVFAAAGVFGGGGPLTHVIRSSADGRLKVEYERFVRRDAPSRTGVLVGQPGEGDLVLELAGDFTDAIELESVTPVPSSQEQSARALVLRFSAREGPTAIHLEYLPLRAGILSGSIRIAGSSAAIATRQLAYF